MIGSVMMYFYPFYWSVTIGCFIIGIGMYGRLVVSYIYCLELVDEESSKGVATIAMTLNASCSGFVALYYILGGRDAELLILVGMALTLYSMVLMIFLPESPKLLYELKKYDACRG